MSSLILVIIFLGTEVFSQEAPNSSKYNESYLQEVVLVKIKPEKITRAKEIIQLYQEASKAACINYPEVYWLPNSDYDLMLIWKVKNGRLENDWTKSPNSQKWWQELLRQQGSEENAKQLVDEYTRLVEQSTNYLSSVEVIP
ncbi:MAG TPA: hypothetical protein VKA27_15635 [Sunxiuqinia sp.]|nr:hypothetical protein [Sunxiuqinia sp.]